MQTDIHFSSYIAQLSLEWEMFQTKNLGKIKIYFMFNIFFFVIMLLRDNVEKFCRAGQAKCNNMVHPHCMLNT